MLRLNGVVCPSRRAGVFSTPSRERETVEQEPCFFQVSFGRLLSVRVTSPSQEEGLIRLFDALQHRGRQYVAEGGCETVIDVCGFVCCLDEQCRLDWLICLCWPGQCSKCGVGVIEVGIGFVDACSRVHCEVVMPVVALNDEFGICVKVGAVEGVKSQPIERKKPVKPRYFLGLWRVGQMGECGQCCHEALQSVGSDGPSVVTFGSASCSVGRASFPAWRVQRLRGGCGRRWALPTTPDTHTTSRAWRLKGLQDHRISGEEVDVAVTRGVICDLLIVGYLRECVLAIEVLV